MHKCNNSTYTVGYDVRGQGQRWVVLAKGIVELRDQDTHLDGDGPALLGSDGGVDLVHALDIDEIVVRGGSSAPGVTTARASDLLVVGVSLADNNLEVVQGLGVEGALGVRSDVAAPVGPGIGRVSDSIDGGHHGLDEEVLDSGFLGCSGGGQCWSIRFGHCCCFSVWCDVGERWEK